MTYSDVRTAAAVYTRWDALDVLRGLTIILMLMNRTPGFWAHNYVFLVVLRL